MHRLVKKITRPIMMFLADTIFLTERILEYMIFFTSFRLILSDFHLKAIKRASTFTEHHTKHEVSQV